MNSKYTFWELLSKNKIQIPIIQRDYAQGRQGKEFVRKNFLEQLGKALSIISCKQEDKTAELDFVYGTENSGKMFPLDGQQRLTTLWLLHWYVAYKARKIDTISFEADEKNALTDKSYNIDMLEDANKRYIVKTIRTLRNFSYETRSSSREFCEKLCELNYQDNANDIVELITNQTWFFSSWKQDPTIQSMLRMLSGTTAKNKDGKNFIDGIEELFDYNKDFSSYWETLIGDKCPIQFNYLPLESSELPVSDDLYIKMNARGKALSDFENFKAEFIGWTRHNKKDDSQEYSQEYANRFAGKFASYIDNQWTDIFWDSKSDDGRIDDIFFAFLNRYFLNELILRGKDEDGKEFTADFLQNGKYEENEFGEKQWIAPKDFDYFYGTYYDKNKNKKNNDNKISFNDFSPYEHVLLNNDCLTEELIILFDKLKSLNCNINDFITECSPNRTRKSSQKLSLEFIPNYDIGEEETTAHKIVKKISSITLEQRVIFYAICRYLIKCDSFDKIKFKQWLRVVWNISNNMNEDSSISGFVRLLRLIESLSIGCLNIYDYLSNLQNCNEIQVKEEIAKAKQIILKKNNPLAVGPDELEIIDTENFAFFKGAIRFLYKDADNEVDWSYFSKKWQNAQMYFDASGVKKEYKTKSILLRRYVSLLKNYWSTTFDDKETAWRRRLLCVELSNQNHTILVNNDIFNFDYEHYESQNQDIKKKYAKEFLVQNDIFTNCVSDCIIQFDSPFCHGSTTLHPYNAKASYNYYVLNPRTEWLFNSNEFSFKDENLEKCRQVKLMFGKDVEFKYKGNFFIWYSRPNEKESDIYLMKKDWDDYVHNISFDNEELYDEKRYFCFKIDAFNSTVEEFKKQLNTLLESYSALNKA